MFELSLVLLSRPHFTRVSAYALRLGKALMLQYGVIFPFGMSQGINHSNVNDNMAQKSVTFSEPMK